MKVQLKTVEFWRDVRGPGPTETASYNPPNKRGATFGRSVFSDNPTVGSEPAIGSVFTPDWNKKSTPPAVPVSNPFVARANFGRSVFSDNPTVGSEPALGSAFTPDWNKRSTPPAAAPASDDLTGGGIQGLPSRIGARLGASAEMVGNAVKSAITPIQQFLVDHGLVSPDTVGLRSSQPAAVDLMKSVPPAVPAPAQAGTPGPQASAEFDKTYRTVPTGGLYVAPDGTIRRKAA